MLNFRSLPARLASAGACFVALVLTSQGVSAECIATTIDDPSRQQGPDGQNLITLYHRMLDDLYVPGGATRVLEIGGVDHQVPPWYDSSTECGEGDLKDWGEVVSNPDGYVLNLDELSELAVVTSLGKVEDRMVEIDNTVQALSAKSGYAGLPCWIARVDHLTPTLECLSPDTASDATARLGLAYYHAAANPNFSAAGRSHFLERARAVAASHRMYEYAQVGCHTSGVTDLSVCNWVFGGADAADNASQMWIGYFQDLALFLLAAFSDMAQATDEGVAEDLVDQYLMASEYDPQRLSVGRRDFTWDFAGSTPAPANPFPSDPDYWPWMGNNAWDEADAPRALWIGHVLRMRDLAIGGTPNPTYAALADWVQQMIDTGTHTTTSSCIQYGHDGTCVSVCGGAPKCNGLGYGILSYHRPDFLPQKLDAMLSQYDWTNGRWGGTCYGIYDGVRPLKALAAAVGFDSAAFGGVRPDGCRRLDVQRTGVGSGFVASLSAGIDCGTDCTETWPEGRAVHLAVEPYSGSTFEGWTGSGCAGGDVTLNVDTSCTATFDGSCIDPLDLEPQQITDTRLFAGCGKVTAGSGFEVLDGGDVTLRAGTSVELASGFHVASGGSLRIVAGAE